MEDLTGKQFGTYQIVAPLGEGGMAAVYKAYQSSMERFVAVKVLPRHMASSEEFLNRFRREAKLLAQLQHPNILPVFDYGESDGHPYIVMPFVPSGTLAELIKGQQLPLNKVRRIMTQIGDALAYAHAHGMIHRDIKPSNVLIDESGNCLLTDFGLARMVESSSRITSSGSVLGTPAYMSPEQGAGYEIDHRSDIYSFGVILYEMVTGRIPYNAETPIAIVFKHIQDPLPSARKLNPDIPESLELVLLKALAKSPEDRYQSMEEFLQAMQNAISDTPAKDSLNIQSEKIKASVSAQPSGNKSKPWRWVIASGVAGIVILCLVVGGIFGIRRFIRSNRNTPNNTPKPEVILLATEIPATQTPLPQPTETALPNVSQDAFQDDFAGQLAEGWTWLSENPSRWSLSEVDGSLQILASDASLDGPLIPPNILLRDAPAGDFEIETALHFTPTRNFQAAGLVIFQEQGNALQFGRAFCDIEGACVGDGVYFDNFENSSITNSHHIAYQGSVIYLRLQRVGNIYTGFYSEDGENWTVIGEHIRDFSQVRVGLIAAQASTEIPAVFGYFKMKTLQP